MLRGVALLLLLAPLAVASTPGHPHDHRYVGAAAQAGTAAWAAPACSDAAPVDGDPESGVGGACFPYATVHGDDAGSTVTVWLEEDVPVGDVYFLVCLDYGWDGACSGLDVQDACHTGGAQAGSYSFTTNGPCLAYLDPAVQGVMLYVLPLPAHPLAGNAQPVSGRAWLT